MLPTHQLLLAPECFQQVDYVFLSESPEHLDFAKSSFPHNLVLCNSIWIMRCCRAVRDGAAWERMHVCVSYSHADRALY
jgi:hypothetical protein